MGKCPFCGENIRKEARVCRHCNRPILFDLYLGQNASDRDIYEVFKVWGDISTRFENSVAVGSLKDLKNLTKSSDLKIIWNLNELEADEISKKLPLSKRLQNPLQAENLESRDQKSSWPQVIYASLVFAVVAVGSYLYFNPQTRLMLGISEREEHPSNLDLSSEGNTVSFVQPQQLDQPTKPSYSTRPSQNSQKNQLSREEMIHLLNASVFILGEGSLGSGFFISSDGYILSNAHVTSPMQTPRVVLQNGRQFYAQKIKEDKNLDVALIKIDVSGAPFLELGDANEIYPGQDVITIGNPSGYSFTVTRGIVSYVGRNLNGVKFIQTDAAINPGNSGGPMITSNFKVVGINSRKASQEEGISFALPINYVYANNGIAKSIARYPVDAPGFQENLSTTHSGTSDKPPADPLRDSKNSNDGLVPADTYRDEADDLKAKYEKQFSEWQSSYDQIKEKYKTLNAELAAKPSLFSRIEELKKQIKDTEEEEKQARHDLADLQRRHIDRLISLYQRWKVDGRFQSQASAFDAQIESLEAQKKQIEESL